MTRILRWVRREFLSSRFVAFLVAGGLAALVNIGSRVLLAGVMPYIPSIVVAYVIGMMLAFLLNRKFVFGSSDRGVARELLIFAGVNLLAIAQTVLVSTISAWYLLPPMGVEPELAETLGHIAGVMVPAFTSFLGHKYWTFRESR